MGNFRHMRNMKKLLHDKMRKRRELKIIQNTHMTWNSIKTREKMYQRQKLKIRTRHLLQHPTTKRQKTSMMLKSKEQKKKIKMTRQIESLMTFRETKRSKLFEKLRSFWNPLQTTPTLRWTHLTRVTFDSRAKWLPNTTIMRLTKRTRMN